MTQSGNGAATFDLHRQSLAGFDGSGARAKTSHAATGKYLLAALAQFGSVLLQTLLNRSVVAQLLPAKALRITPAGLLLLWRAHMTLCKR
jgi:hypothetical protein